VTAIPAKPVVLHAVSRFLPRSETFVYTVVAGHRGFAAEVLCHGVEFADEFPFPRVHVEPIPETKWSPNWWSAAFTEWVTGRSPWRRRVESLLERIRPSVIHAHFGPVGCQMAAVARASGIPLVTSLYGVDAAVLPYTSRWRDQYVRLFRDGDLFLAEGPEMRKLVIAAGAPVERTVLQPIAIDLRKYPTWRPDATITVLFVGRFIEKKGLLDAIAAFASAHSRLPGARLTIVGNGPDESAARALVAERGLIGVVEFVGTKPHADVIARLARARVLIHPSATAADGDSEGGAPTILLEAQAIGTPIVSTRHADIPYIAAEGPGVYLSDEHDIDGLARDLVAAVESGKRSIGAHLKSRHDVSSAVASLESHYRTAIGRATRAVAV